MKRDGKKDEESASGGNPFAHLDKTSVLQECRVFHETPIQPRRCASILTRLIYIIWHGEQIGRHEATDAFFAITKLWQSKCANLRLLVYLAITELSAYSSDVIIVTQSLTKDMTGKEELYRAPAIRALARIVDASMLQGIERYMKQAIVDKSAPTASAALISSLHMFKKSGELVRRWANEVQEAVSHEGQMTQYHALALLYHIRADDPLAVAKLVIKCSKQGLRSPFALVYLIRIAARLLEDEDDDNMNGPLFSFIDSCLRNKSEMVVLEAATAIVNLPNSSAQELAPAVSVLQMHLSSPKAALRFAAVKTLNRISMKHPQCVSSCNVDLEKLIVDQNRSIAVLAITTLLKTGGEASVERLMKQIITFVQDISDEFKVVVVDAIRSLCARWPRKHVSMMPFLQTMLRQDGGLAFKRAIVDTLITIIEENPDARQAGLSHLCEFIEDCEHTSLATRVLHLLGREAPRTANPGQYIRFVYNRVILEATQVRAAAVSALAKLGAACDSLRPSIVTLLRRCELDVDDEVRDRATFYLHLLLAEEEEQTAKKAQEYIIDQLQVSPQGLERCLANYLAAGDFARPFDLRTVPLSAQPLATPAIQPAAGQARAAAVSADGGAGTTLGPGRLLDDVQDAAGAGGKQRAGGGGGAAARYAERLAAVPLLAGLGPPLRSSSAPVPLTDSVTEYTVQLVKHTYAEHLVLQFDCTNTLNDQLLEAVRVKLEDGGAGEWTETLAAAQQTPIARLAYGEPASAYVLLEWPAEVAGTLRAALEFRVRDVDPTTGEPEGPDAYDEEYPLEDIDILVADSVEPLARQQNFEGAWEKLGQDGQVQSTFELDGTMSDAAKKVAQTLGAAVCERTDRIPDAAKDHVVLLSGRFRGGAIVLAKAHFVLDPRSMQLHLSLAIRSDDRDVAEVCMSAM